jgi:hypothetical protein
MSAPPPRHLRARSRRLFGPTALAAVAARGSSAAVAVRFALAQLGKPCCVTVDGDFGPRPAASWSPSSASTASPPDGVVGLGRSTWGKLVANGRQRSPARC